MFKTLPKDFMLGGATVAYQVEGATREGGKGYVAWDEFLETQGRFSQDTASDFYNRFVDDLVLCAGAGTSAMLANALTEGAKEVNAPITSTAGAYGSHYDIMKGFDIIILAP